MTDSIQLAASLGQKGADFTSVYIKHGVSVSLPGKLAPWAMIYVPRGFTGG